MPDVFAPGNLVRIKDFQFEDGSTRDKYLFVLLRNDDGVYVISSLATSQNKMNVSAIRSGCYYDTRISTYYHFPAGEVFGDGNFSFDKETYIFFRENVRKIEVADLTSYTSITDPFAVASITTLKNEELKKLLHCVVTSTFTPEDLKAELTAFKDTL
ncbi:MAG: hypothetical protein NW218_00935 [Saprospiraceae bacterium]|nr:hypothetical protein [Saprospiraceae bacterium]